MKNRPLPSVFLVPISALLILGCPGALAQTLLHRYSFNDPATATTFADSVGGGAWSGTLQGSAVLDGSSLQLDGYGGYARLPERLVSTLGQVSIEFWAAFSQNNPVWTRVFAFGDQDGNGNARTSLDYCHYAGGDWQNLGLRTPSANIWANNPGGLNGATNVHVTLIVDPAGNRMFYYNGTAVRSNPGVNGGSVPPLSGVSDSLCYLGKSLYDVDATLAGAINEFRIYAGALSPAAVAINDAAGPDRYVSDPGALTAVHLTSAASALLVNQTSQQLFTGDFANVTGVNLALYGGATFTSQNPSVLTVHALTGLARAVSAGTVNVVATYQGRSATNQMTVLAAPATLTHRYSFDANAQDLVGTAHGTLMGHAAVAGGKVELDGTDGTYVDLPGRLINIATNKSLTLEAWVDFGDVPSWSRLFDFGADGGANEIYLAPQGPGNGGQHRGISENISGGQTIDWQGAWTNQSAHITVVFDPPSSMLAVYRDGVLEYGRYDAGAALSLISTDLAVLGKSLVAVDPYMPGAIDEFRIYSGALTAQEIAMTHKNGPGAVARDPGALQSIRIPPTHYPANSGIVPPVVLANYANLTDFNLLPNSSAIANGLTLASSDPAVLQVLPNNMLRTLRPGAATLTASYLGKTAQAPVTVQNLGALAHRYSFSNAATDSVGGAHGTLMGNAAVADSKLVLDGSGDTYVELPPALLKGYDAVTVDTWVTFNAAATWARLWYFGDDRANEFYLAPSVLGGDSHWLSTGFPIGGETITLSPRWENETLHVTCVYGNGSMAFYTNGVLHGIRNEVQGRLDEVGTWYSWIGRSPYADPFMDCVIDEFRIYRGSLAPDEILATDILGPDQLPASTAALKASAGAGGITLSWPVAAAGFSVQTAPSLAGPWTTIPDAPTLVGNTSWQATVPAGPGAGFFRLWR